jgi:hypothetical protein
MTRSLEYDVGGGPSSGVDVFAIPGDEVVTVIGEDVVAIVGRRWVAVAGEEGW